MKDKDISRGPWVEADLCSSCGEDLGNVTQDYWGKPCPNCAATSTFCPGTIKTAKRYVVTKKILFFPIDGYWEWSGKASGGGKISADMMGGRIISNNTTTIAAAGIASGLF